MDKILAAVAILMGAQTPITDISLLKVSPEFMQKATLRTGVGATVIPTGGGYLIMTVDPTRKDWIAHELCHVIQYERGDNMKRIHRAERECYRVQAQWARQNGVRGRAGHVPGEGGETPSGGGSGGPGGGSDGGSGGGGNSGHSDNGNHYGNDRPDNNSHDQNNKHNEAE